MGTHPVCSRNGFRTRIPCIPKRSIRSVEAISSIERQMSAIERRMMKWTAAIVGFPVLVLAVSMVYTAFFK